MMSEVPKVWTEESLRHHIAIFHSTSYSWKGLHQRAPALNERKKAAVLIPLYIKDGQLHVWLTLRSDRVAREKGIVSFPGGKKDPQDVTAVDTCLRESHEEIGLEADDVEILVEMVPVIAGGFILTTPVVGLVSPDFIPKPNEEVSKCFSLPLQRFLTDVNHGLEYEYYGQKGIIHFFHDNIDGDLLVTWGLTATILIEIAVGLFKRMPEFDLYENDRMTIENPSVMHEEYLEMHEKRFSAWRAEKMGKKSKL